MVTAANKPQVPKVCSPQGSFVHDVINVTENLPVRHGNCDIRHAPLLGYPLEQLTRRMLFLPMMRSIEVSLSFHGIIIREAIIPVFQHRGTPLSPFPVGYNPNSRLRGCAAHGIFNTAAHHLAPFPVEYNLMVLTKL